MVSTEGWFELVSIPSFLISSFMHMLMGAVWYNPRVCGDAFMRIAHGGKMPAKDPRAMKAAGLGSCIAMPFFCFMLRAAGCATPGQGALWGFCCGLCLDGGLNLPHSFFEERPFALYAIHRGYHIVSLVLVGAVLGAVCFAPA